MAEASSAAGSATTASASSSSATIVPPQSVQAVATPPLSPKKATTQSPHFESFMKEALEVIAYTGPYKQLWNLLSGVTKVVSADIIHEQLKTRCDKIISALTQYKEVVHGKLDVPSDIKNKMKVQIMEKYNLPDSIAIEILCTYLLFEYNGLVVSLEKLLATKNAQKEFIDNIEEFYKRERLCIIYCSQMILASAVDEQHIYFDVYGGFVTSASMEDWTKYLCGSLNDAICSNERIEILHTLTLMVYHYALYENVAKVFKDNYSRVEVDDDEVQMAEAVLVLAFLQCGDSTVDKLVHEFVLTHVMELKENPFMVIPMMSYFTVRYSGSPQMKSKIMSFLENRCSMEKHLELANNYSRGKISYRHGIGPIALKCSYSCLEGFLTLVSFQTLTSQNKEDYFLTLDTFFKDKDIAYSFLCEQPECTSRLYEEALLLFPIQVDSALSYWASFAGTANEEVTALEIMEKVSQLNYLAEYAVYVQPTDYSPLEGGVISNIERELAGVVIPAGTKGVLLQGASGNTHPIISWALDNNSDQPSVWEVIFNAVIKPALDTDELSDAGIKRIKCLAEFLARFSELSSEVPLGVLRLFPPVAHILRRLEEEISDYDFGIKGEFVSQLLQIVSCGSKFETEFLHEQSPGLWPFPGEENIVNQLIVGHESMSNFFFLGTKGFLKSLLDLLLNGGQDEFPTSATQTKSTLTTWRLEMYRSGVAFVITEILPSFVRWKFIRYSDQSEILRDCFRVFHCIFNLGASWEDMRLRICKELVKPNSSLLALLRTDEEELQDCRIRPTDENINLESTMQLGMSLLLRVVNHYPPAIHMLDMSSGCTLVQCMAKLFRHRVIVSVPCLAIKLLTRIANDLNMSILSCIGNQVEIFRDLVLLRLSYKSEDTDLRVAILDFLAVCVQSQVGMMNHFLESDALAECVFSLLEEEDLTVPPATLYLVRVVIGKGNAFLKTRTTNLWKLVSGPISNLGKFELSQQKLIITYTLNIFSFELYREGIIDQDLCDEVSKVLETPALKNIVQIAIQDSEDGWKCLLSIKHLLTLILSRPDLVYMLKPAASLELSKLVTSEFMRNKDYSSNVYNELVPALAELMLVFAGEQNHEYLEELVTKLVEDFFVASIAVQIPLLACLNKVVSNLKNQDISLTTANGLVKIISKIFNNAVKVYEADADKNAHPLLSLAASIAYNITQTRNEVVWLPVFHRQMLIMSIVHVANVGLAKATGPEIVLESLGTLVKLCKNPETSACVRNATLCQSLWYPALRFANVETTGKWIEVYLMCCELNTVLVETEKNSYVDDGLNFWGFHGAYLAFKLFDMADIVNNCFLRNFDKNFDQLMRTLTFNYFTLKSILVMIPYVARWRLQQPASLASVLDGVFAALQAAVSLLTHPSHLLHVITKNSKSSSSSSTSAKLTPSLMEVQLKLWDMMLMGVNIYLKLRKCDVVYVDCNNILPLLYSIIALPVRALSKHGDKKIHPAINSSVKIVLTLEKSLLLLFLRITAHIDHPTMTGKQKQAFKRETMSEVTSLCDSVRRLGFTGDDYSVKVCSLLESVFKDNQN